MAMTILLWDVSLVNIAVDLLVLHLGTVIIRLLLFELLGTMMTEPEVLRLHLRLAMTDEEAIMMSTVLAILLDMAELPMVLLETMIVGLDTHRIDIAVMRHL